MNRFDLFVKFVYDVRDGSFEIDSNVKEGRRKELLGEWIRAQMGKNGDAPGVPFERAQYTIKIMLDLSSDTFHVDSDTGNSDLTLGIVGRVVRQLA